MRVVRVKVRIELKALECIEFVLEHNGVYYYRVVKLVRLLRNPREYAQIETALEIHRDFVSSTRELPNARLVLLTCNSKKYGLLWCYGVAVTALNEDEALVLAEGCFDALVASLKGTYRQAVFRLLTAEEAQEILRLMQSGNGLAILGIPEPRDSYARAPKALGFQIGVKIIEMLEELIRGLMDREFLYLILAEPVEPRKLVGMLRKVADLASKYSDYQESVNIGFGISIPVGFTLSQGFAENLARSHSRSRGLNESRSVSESRTVSLTESEASSRTVSKGHSVTESESVTKGTARTVMYGTAETQGVTKGESVGTVEGRIYSMPSTTRTEPLSESRQYLVPHQYRVEQTGERKVGVWEGYHEQAGGVGYKGNPGFGGSIFGSGVRFTAPGYGYHEQGQRGLERHEELKLDAKEVEVKTPGDREVLTGKTVPAETKTTPLNPSV
ncbi:MAG: hypothetical protein DRJ52_11090, partial [Thermoprotei archaeon]